MLRQLGGRLAAGAGIVLLVVTLTFSLISLAPGDPARLWVGPGAGEAELAAARRALDLDRPLAVRYMSWLVDFARGDWGASLAQQRPVTHVLWDALPHTLVLTGASLLLTYVGGIVLGLLQAIMRRSALDTGLTVTSLFVYGMPAYWLAIMLVLVFSYGAARFGWPEWLQFPALGVAGLDADFLSPWDRVVDRLRHLALPLATLGAIGIAGTARFVRGAVLDVRGSGFVRTARAKGLAPATVETRHVLRNGLLPVITLLGLSLPALVSGTVFVEVVFAWPGMGRVMVAAVGARDYPVVMAATALFAVLVVLGNLLADLLYAVADPRLRRGLS
ncbi:MAG: ABC transporter permease [Gemmatimonadota bacterium]|nr:ABC transporter permease [Gemmatimonadota bacterium]